MVKLFEPITLRDLTIRNRAWLSPMCQYSVWSRDGVPNDWHLTHLGARAAGGFGLVTTEATAVNPVGRISPQDTGLWNDEQCDAWRRIVHFGHTQGAAMGVQLAHAGRKAATYHEFGSAKDGSIPQSDGGWQTIAPSAIPFPADAAVPREATTDDLDRVVDDFAAAAQRADEAGFDVVEVHGAHGYLLAEFLSPLSNHRTDDYGGSFDNRVRLFLRVVDAVRAAWPSGKPLLTRISATEWLDEGWQLEDSVRLARLLHEHGVDLVDCSSGGNALVQIPIGPGYQVHLARAVRAAGVPSGAVGIITDPAQAEEILQAGDADVVILGRVALREPSWPLRAAHELGLAVAEAPYPPQYPRGAWRH